MILFLTNIDINKDIVFKNVVILMTCVIKYNDKFYPQLFLEEALSDEETQRKALKKI